MRGDTKMIFEAQRARGFDVICAGEARSQLNAPGGAVFMQAMSLRVRPGGGAVNAALALARQGLRVGLATALGDDSFGRALLDRVAAAGIDVGGVALAPRAGLVVVEGGGGVHQVVGYREEDPPVTVPAGWSAPVLLLSGLSPALAYSASLCKAARAARRAGTIVVVDVNARWHLWAGHDARAIQSVLREADVVRCSAQDLDALGLNVDKVRAILRPSAVLVTNNGAGNAWATGPFGEVAHASRAAAAFGATGSGDAFTAAICAELARAGTPGEARPDLWDRALQRGHAAASARAAARS